MTAPRTARVYDIERDRPAAELREWSDSDDRLGNLLEEEQAEVDTAGAAVKVAQVLLLCVGVVVVTVGVMIVCK